MYKFGCNTSISQWRWQQLPRLRWTSKCLGSAMSRAGRVMEVKRVEIGESINKQERTSGQKAERRVKEKGGGGGGEDGRGEEIRLIPQLINRDNREHRVSGRNGVHRSPGSMWPALKRRLHHTHIITCPSCGTQCVSSSFPFSPFQCLFLLTVAHRCSRDGWLREASSHRPLVILSPVFNTLIQREIQ